MKEYKKHSLNILPNCNKLDYDRLQGSLRANGFDKKFPIILFEGKILDGWQRYQICEKNNIDFTTAEFEGNKKEAIKFVRESNIRRNMTEDQIATFIIDSNGLLDEYEAEAREREREGKRKGGLVRQGKLPRSTEGKQKSPEYTDIAAKDFGTTGGKVRRAKKLKEASPEEFEKVKSGEKKLHEAEKSVPTSRKITKKKSDKPKDDSLIYSVSKNLAKVTGDLQKILQGDHKPTTKLDWGRLSTINYALYDIIRLAASMGVDVVSIAETFNGTKKITTPKHLRIPKEVETTGIEEAQIIE